ncbi:uncharacterized protein LOC128679162 isoform X2 [Plodia interpunctella]|uniref:uncharacterized protein LOC128679162 isoform X2 n=1 Tax=Plodia interpunctella TaxID=58824 RepID=UPI002368B2EC|nr:uncharacterized protein LOC128679162 isoform X2 [Plodia interpunctella]
MDLSVEQVIEGLLSEESQESPSDTGKPSELVLELPDWYDEKQFNQGRRFFWDNCFMLSTSMLLGLLAVFAVPSILKILVSTRRSNSTYTAYRRYLSTLLHTTAWLEHELKPGSTSWRSLTTVRTRHLRASMGAKAKGLGVVSQRDIALTQFGFIGFSMLKPDKFGINQLRPGDWEAYNHVWRSIGYMIGLEDRYNICRKTFGETRQVCQILLERFYTPALENVPEYFEHSARVMLNGMWHVNPTIDPEATLYWCRHLADVPGYVYTDKERIDMQSKLMKHLKGKALDEGVDSTLLMSKPVLTGLPERGPRLLHLKDYETLDTVPEYKRLKAKGKRKLGFAAFAAAMYSTYLGRLYFNLNYLFSLLLMKYCPYLAFFSFGIKASLVNIFVEDPMDDEQPKPNAEYYKPQPPEPWYKEWLALLWW